MISNNKTKIRIGLVGCGRIIQNHIKAIILNSSRAEIIAICDENEDNLERTRVFIEEKFLESNVEKKNIFLFRNYAELISSKEKLKLDLIVLATPSGLHSEQTILAAKAGINVCTEKPMAIKWQDGLDMTEACKKEGVKLFVVKQNRFNTTLKLVREQIKNGSFGKIALITINVFWHRPQSYYDQDSWRGKWDLDGGALMNQASHYIDLIDWLIGPVESINASIATIGRDIEAEDTAVLKIKWKMEP